MRKFYQTQWHGIKFNSIRSISISRLPDEDFYNHFYANFSKKYSSISELDPDWLRLKFSAADWLVKQIKDIDPKSALSLGVGLAILENHIKANLDLDLHVHEVSDSVRNYIDANIPEECIHIGLFPECLDKALKFDLIIMGGIEYIFDDQELEKFLTQVADHLHPQGKLLLISWSFYERSLYSTVKHYIKELLIRLPLFQKNKQFWGYLRTQDQLKVLARKAGLQILSSEKDESVGDWKTLFLTLKRD